MLRARLIVIHGPQTGTIYAIWEGENLLGRLPADPAKRHLHIEEPPENISVSRCHAMVHAHGESLDVEDLSSTNGTFLNGIKLTPGRKYKLKEKDLVQLAKVVLKVLRDSDQVSNEETGRGSCLTGVADTPTAA